MDKFFKKPALNQFGIVSPLILIGIVSVLLLFVILGNFPLKDKLLGTLFPKQFSQAAGVVDLSLVPDTINVAKDQTFLVDVAIDTKTDQPSAMVLAITYDPAVLQATAAEQGFFFTEDLDPVTPKINNGTIQMTLGQKPNQYKTGTGIIATLSFKALQTTVPTTAIQINTTNTQIAAIGKTGNQLGNATGSTVTVTDTPVVVKTAQFTLAAPSDAQAGAQFDVPLKVLTTEEANLFSARLSFDPLLLEVVNIDTGSSFISAGQWVSNNFDNTTGEINLIGGVPNPGYKNTVATTMATIAFRGKAAGSAQVNFGANSAIYRNVDNVDILATPTGATINITGVTASPSPSPSVAPSVVPSASPSVAPSASPSPSPALCSISQANWVTPTNPVTQGKVVGLSVTGTSNCAGQSVSFKVFEDDGVWGTDTVKNIPPTTKFNTSNVATSNWLAEYQTDPSLIANNIPEYFFIAQLSSGITAKSLDPELQVTELGAGAFLTGDADHSGKVDERDLSILLTNWNKISDFIDELDLNVDGVVNSIDWATMIQILRVTDPIKYRILP